MSDVINIYCDESCHLEHDQSPVMLLGALSCPALKAREVAVKLREIKQRRGMNPIFETKWTKVSNGGLDFYKETLDYFLSDPDLGYRGWVIVDKTQLDHEHHKQTHDQWYYKMYFHLLEPLISPDKLFRIYLDKKDTLGGGKVRMLHDILCNNMYDFDHKIIEHIQIVHSHEIEQIQLCDLLNGVVAYANRGLQSSAAKLALVQHVEAKTGRSLLKNTLIREPKLNIFHWKGQV
jgi:hypothetical protein